MKKDSAESYPLKKALLQVSEAVLATAVLIVLGMQGGSWLDEKLHTQPWLSLILSLAGAGLGLWRMVLKAIALDSSKGN